MVPGGHLVYFTLFLFTWSVKYSYKKKGSNEWKNLTKHILCECKRKFDRGKCNSNQKCNSDKCWCESKKHKLCEKDYIWNRASCSCENGKYLANVMDDSVITCVEIIEPYDKERKTVSTNFNEKK